MMPRRWDLLLTATDDECHWRGDSRQLRAGGQDERHIRLDAHTTTRNDEQDADHGATERDTVEGLAGFLRHGDPHLHVRLAVLVADRADGSLVHCWPAF